MDKSLSTSGYLIQQPSVLTQYKTYAGMGLPKYLGVGWTVQLRGDYFG
jgi:hypothetical protein